MKRDYRQSIEAKMKRSGAVVLVFGLLIFVMAGAAGAQERLVALVFDDSGSMKGEPFLAVNYALQAMVGLLNPDDRFFVVKMQRPGSAVEIDLKAKQAEIDGIRGWAAGGGTPFGAVDTAMTILERSSARERWLIIFTDGKVQMTAASEQRISDFINQSGAKTIILNINVADNPLAAAFRRVGQAEILRSPAAFERIVEEMGHMALTVMSMTRSGLTVKPGQRVVKVSTVVPLKRLIILEQDPYRLNRLVRVESVQAEGGKPLHMAGSFEAEVGGRIYGRITHITHSRQGDRVIPEGDIRIAFDDRAELSRFKFLPEVAAKLTAEPKGSFKEVAGNVYTVCSTANRVRVEAQLTTLTGKPLKPEVLANSKVLLHYGSLTAEMALQGTVFVKPLEMTEERLPVSVSARYPGYFHFRSNVFVLKKVFCEPDKLGVVSSLKVPPIKVTELDQAPGVTIKPLLNNREVTAEEFGDLYLERMDDSGLDLEIETKEGVWLVRPKAKWGIPCFTKTGIQRIELELRARSREVVSTRTVVEFDIRSVSFFRKCGAFLIGLLAFLFLLWYAWGIYKKPRFCRGSEMVYQRSTRFRQARAMTFPLCGSFFKRYLIPYLPETRVVEGIKFKSSRRCSYIYLPREVQDKRMSISGERIEDPGRRDWRISNGEELLVDSGNYRESYKYSLL
jgi:hypothetical protein